MKHLPTETSHEKVQELRKFIQSTKDLRTRDRARAILARMNGSSRQDLALLLDVHRDTISNWITMYRKQGIKGLCDRPQKGNKFKLSPEQKNHIKHIVLSHTPRQLGMDHDYWDIVLLEELITKLYHVQYNSKKSYIRLYKYIGF